MVEFVQRLHEKLGEIQRAYESEDLEQLASLAHWLKGSGGTAGFDAFTVPARELEQLAKSGSSEGVEQGIARLRCLAESIVVDDSESLTTHNDGNQ